MMNMNVGMKELTREEMENAVGASSILCGDDGCWSGHTHHCVCTGNHREGNFFIFWTRTEYQHVCTECRDVDWFANILSE